MRKLTRASPATILLLGSLGLATMLALLAPLGWPFELFAHFRAQLAATALVFAAVFAWRRNAGAAALALALLLVHALPLAQRVWSAPASLPCSGPGFTVATVNLHYSNAGHERFLQWLDRQPVDLIVVQEVTRSWVSVLASRADYPHRFLLSREDPYGIGVLSRWPMQAVGTVDLAGDGLPSIEGTVDLPGRRIRFLGLHTHWPILPGLARSRDRALARVAEITRTADLPVVLLGDLNLTADSPVFPRLLRESGLRDAMHGVLWRPTWQAGFWPLALRIDHVLASPQICVERVEVGPSIGSDHRPVTARLRLSR